MAKKKDPIKDILESIDDTLKRQNSTRRIFVQGLTRGFGTALGATVLLAIATSVTISFVDVFDPQTFLEFFISDVTTD